GSIADHRLAATPARLDILARALAARLGASTGRTLDLDAQESRFIEALAADLLRAGGDALVVPGEYASPAMHDIAHWINQRLGSVGRTVFHTQPSEARPIDQIASLRELAADLDSGAVEVLLILGGNPVYGAP